MADLLASLSNDQRTLIKCIAEPFIRFQKWPFYGYVEAELDKRGIEARQIIASLPEVGEHGVQHFRYGLLWYPRTIPTDDTPIALTLAGLWQLGEPAGLKICDQFIHVLSYLIERRLSASFSPFERNSILLTNKDVADRFPNMIPSAVSSLGIFFPHEAATFAGAQEPTGDGQWRIELRRNLLQYQGIKTFVEYLERVTEQLAPPAVEPEPIALSSLDLCATLDYFNAVWQLQFDQKKPIIRLFGAERTARLVYGVNTMDEFSTQLSSLTEILKNMSIPGDGKTPLIRLRAFLQSQLPAESHARIDDAVSSLRSVTEVRNALFQHSGTEHRAVRALTNLGLGFPVTDWQAAWESIQRHVINAFTALREEIQLAREIED